MTNQGASAMAPAPGAMEPEIAAAPEQVPVVKNTPPAGQPQAPTPSAQEVGWQTFVAPAWFFLGILVGLVLFAVYAQVTRQFAPPPQQTLDTAQIKQAAREGLMEAIRDIQSQSSGNNSEGPSAVDPNVFAVREANVLGDPNAKVTIVEYADFQCPFCGRHHTAVSPGIIETYVNTGKVRMIYKHLAFLGPESVYAAVASECAADQGKFWEYHDYLFEHQNGENQGAFNKDKLIEFGKTLELDMTRFEPCVTNDETIARVQADTEEAAKFNVGSTPTFFVNGQPLVGLKSPAEFQAVIESALNQ